MKATMRWRSLMGHFATLNSFAVWVYGRATGLDLWACNMVITEAFVFDYSWQHNQLCCEANQILPTV